MELLIVDGYNIIGAWPDLRSTAQGTLEDARIQLVERLREYAQVTGRQVVVVFDAHLSGRLQRSEEKYGNLQVVYTKAKETADHYIERMADRYSGDPRYQVRVATGDAMEQRTVLSRGATRVSTRELALELSTAQNQIKRVIKKPQIKSRHGLEDRLSPEQVERLRKLMQDE